MILRKRSVLNKEFLPNKIFPFLPLFSLIQNALLLLFGKFYRVSVMNNESPKREFDQGFNLLQIVFNWYEYVFQLSLQECESSLWYYH